jgi:hypothetical protein
MRRVEVEHMMIASVCSLRGEVSLKYRPVNTMAALGSQDE